MSAVRPRTRRHGPAPDPSTLPPDALLTRRQLAHLTSFTEQTFKRWERDRRRGAGERGPRVVYVEGRPRTRVADFRAWIGAVDQISEPAGSPPASVTGR